MTTISVRVTDDLAGELENVACANNQLMAQRG